MTVSYLLPSEEIVRQMARLAIKQATRDLARIADDTAAKLEHGLLPPVSAPEALRAFAVSIRSNNAKVWPPQAGASA